MNKQEVKTLRPGDRIRAANGQTGIVVLNEEKITVQWDDGTSVTGSHDAGWMCETISMVVQR